MVITRQLTDSASASTASDIQLGSCVTEIGQGAFSGYTNITDVEFPDSLTTIGVGAFSGSSITSVEFPDNLETIGDSAFENCNGLETVNIPDSVLTIGNYAFYTLLDKRLTEVTIGSGITSIGLNAFLNQTNINRMTIKALTPPTLGNNALNGSYLIYVPYDSYNDYISATDWTSYKNRIVYTDFPYKAMFFNATGGSENFVPCNESSVLTRDEVVNTITTAVTKVTLGNCINTVGSNYASVFSGYTSLNEIEFSNSITAITKSAFARTNAHITTLPSSVATIGEYAFSGTDATVKISFDSLTIGNDITSIGYGAFKYCSIGTLNLTSTATTYRSDIFSNTNITNLNIGNTVTKISDSMFEYSSGFTSLTIPNSVTTIEYSGFRRCYDLKTLTINGNTTIGSYGFSSCSSLSSVTMPNVTEIGSSAFYSCSSLKKINASSTYDAVINLNTIPSNAFYSNSFETLELGANVTNINGDSFSNNSSLKKIHIIGNSSTNINGAFNSCISLEEVVIDNASSINTNTFNSSNTIKKVTIGNYSSIDNGLFQGKTSLTSLTLSNAVTSIGNQAFSGCTSLTNVELPNALTSIGASAFTNCSSMTTLIIPDSVVSIGNQAFSGCSGLNSILIGRSTPPTIGTNVFASSNCLIYVPQASYDLYVNAENWSTYRDRIFATGTDYKAMLIGGTTKIIECNGNTTLAQSEVGTNNAETINIGNCVTAIGDSAFTSSNSIQTVSIPSGVTSIGNYAFSKYRSTLTTVSGLQGVETIGDYAFQYCSGLTSISFSDSLTSIGGFAFCGTSLTTIVVPSGVTEIKWGAFQSSALTSVTFEGLTPPTLVKNSQYSAPTNSYSGYYALVNHKIPIYVPCAAYDSYMTAWASTDSSPITDCLVPCDEPTPPVSANKLDATYNDGTSFSIPCDDDSSLTRSMITAHTTSHYNMITAIIGNCVTEIGFSAFQSCYNLTSVTVNASTPPTLGGYAFDATNNCPIYVPAASVDAYKAATIWSNYASRIQPIQNS